MPYMQNNVYREIAFSTSTPFDDFYTYMDLKEVANKCENDKDGLFKCRTLGTLHSLNGRYYLKDFDSSGTDASPIVQVSMVYLSSPPQSTVIPYPVQILGSVQWKNRPVLFANILQVISAPTALRLKNALSGITILHLAKKRNIQENDET